MCKILSRGTFLNILLRRKCVLRNCSALLSHVQFYYPTFALPLWLNIILFMDPSKKRRGSLPSLGRRRMCSRGTKNIADVPFREGLGPREGAWPRSPPPIPHPHRRSRPPWAPLVDAAGPPNPAAGSVPTPYLREENPHVAKLRSGPAWGAPTPHPPSSSAW